MQERLDLKKTTFVPIYREVLYSNVKQDWIWKIWHIACTFWDAFKQDWFRNDDTFSLQKWYTLCVREFVVVTHTSPCRTHELYRRILRFCMLQYKVFFNENNKQVLYVHIIKVHYGLMISTMQFYDKLKNDLMKYGFNFNSYDPYVAKKWQMGTKWPYLGMLMFLKPAMRARNQLMNLLSGYAKHLEQL